MSKSKKKWVIPANKISEEQPKLHNGEDFNSSMCGAYYGSSLEYNFVTVPQYPNAGKLLCPCSKEIKETFKPKRPYGTFGALVRDTEQSQYRVEVGRSIVEIATVDEATELADSLSSVVSVLADKIDKLPVMKYTATDGSKYTYSQVMEYQRNLKQGNLQIQKQIEQLIKDEGYAPVFDGNKVLRKKYPDHLLAKIAELASLKESITGFNLQLRVEGKHTIAKDGNWYKGSLTQEQLEALGKEFAYRDKTSYKQGTVRVGTLNIPIQNLDQLKAVMKLLSTSLSGVCDAWPKTVQASCIALQRVDRN